MSPKEAGRIERKKEEMKKKIVDVTLRLFNEQGIDATTMEQIAKEVDIAKGTLYNYFPVKEAIISEFIRKAFETENPATMDELAKLPNTRIRMLTMMKMLIEGISRFKELFEKYLVYQLKNMISIEKNEEERKGFISLGRIIISLGQKDNEIRKDLPVELIENLFEFVFFEIAKQFYSRPAGSDMSDIIEQCVELFINGVRNE